MKNLLEQLIKTIKTGTVQEVKQAQKEIEKYWYDNSFDRKNKEKDFEIFLKEMIDFEEI